MEEGRLTTIAAPAANGAARTALDMGAVTDIGGPRPRGPKPSEGTPMTGGMHCMDRYKYDTERVRRCVIQYSTPDGLYPFCTINCGPTYRPFVGSLQARPLA